MAQVGSLKSGYSRMIGFALGIALIAGTIIVCVVLLKGRGGGEPMPLPRRLCVAFCERVFENRKMPPPNATNR